jgi:branched-chain amino acid transport system ATP-binding protein
MTSGLHNTSAGGPLRTISGLIRPLSGTMRFLGQPIDRLSPEAIVKLGVAHVPERRRVFPGLTVRENIVLGGSNHAQASRRELESDAGERIPELLQDWPSDRVSGHITIVEAFGL